MVTATAADMAGLGDNLGRIAEGRPADLVVLSRLAEDAFESVLLSDSHDVDLVMIGGDVTYTRTEWLEQIAPGATAPNLQPVIAWGKQMLLDNGFRGDPDDEAVPTLDDLRADLIKVLPAGRVRSGPDHVPVALELLSWRRSLACEALLDGCARGCGWRGGRRRGT